MLKQQRSSSFFPAWLVLAGMLGMVFWTRNCSLGSQDSTASSYDQSLPVAGCSAAQRPEVALMMVILGHDNETRHDQYWMAVANRRAYAIEHGFPLYLVTEELGSGEHPAWEKLVALQAVFQHSCADWVWMNDADAYIMTLGLDVMGLARDPVAQRNPKQICNTSSPDIIAAGACLTKINTGSMLWRNSDWTRQFVSDAWHSKWIARPASWWDQAAILHMYKIGDSKDRFCIVKQRALNAFANLTGCHDGGGTFEDGDLLVHFPGGMKQAISNMDSAWLKAVPLLPSTLEASPNHASIFTVTSYNPSTATMYSQQVAVSLRSELYAKESKMRQDFNLYIQPQLQGFSNWGWPIFPEPAELKGSVQQQLMARQQEQ